MTHKGYLDVIDFRFMGYNVENGKTVGAIYAFIFKTPDAIFDIFAALLSSPVANVNPRLWASPEFRAFAFFSF